MIRGSRGFSTVEVMVALVILGVGLLALAGGSVFVSRDLVRSRLGTSAALMAEARLETLRVMAGSTPVRCTAAEFASSRAPVESAGVSVSWVVPETGWIRDVSVITAYGLGRNRVKVDTVTGTLRC